MQVIFHLYTECNSMCLGVSRIFFLSLLFALFIFLSMCFLTVCRLSVCCLTVCSLCTAYVLTLTVPDFAVCQCAVWLYTVWLLVIYVLCADRMLSMYYSSVCSLLAFALSVHCLLVSVCCLCPCLVYVLSVCLVSVCSVCVVCCICVLSFCICWLSVCQCLFWCFGFDVIANTHCLYSNNEKNGNSYLLYIY